MKLNGVAIQFLTLVVIFIAIVSSSMNYVFIQAASKQPAVIMWDTSCKNAIKITYNMKLNSVII